jgi:rhamnose utilization protein RhaD (predicted bifunctional aldolase and dehydrogenase)
MNHMDNVLTPVLELSADLGADLRLVQGAGGNVSLKTGRDMWIKGSGIRLAEARQRPIMVRLDLDTVVATIAAGSDDLLSSVRDNSGLRPSIETALHAVMPQRVVAHVHSVNAISWGVRHEGRTLVTDRLAGLAWAWIDYVRPGLPLARAAQAALALRSDATVLLLANHGLVVAGATTAEVRALLDDVELRLAARAKVLDRPELEDIERILPAGCRLPADERVHALALDPALTELTRGVLYPDHAVFLGTSLPLIDAGDARGLLTAVAERPHCAVVKGAGVVLGPACSALAEGMLECLALVAPTLPARDELRFLDDREIGELLGWDAEKFRQDMSLRGPAADAT